MSRGGSESSRCVVGSSAVSDPLSPAERRALLEAPRPRSLPVAPTAARARRSLPLATETRSQDRVRPLYAVWEITLACDLACRHCGSRAGRARPDELSTAECLDVVRQLAELGVKEVTLIGGEAYLREDWLEIVSAVVAHGMIANLTTGGRGVTPELARQAKAAGLHDVSVSIDGLEPTHDRLRGVVGSFRAAVAAMDAFRAAGLRVANNTQINRLTMPELPELVEVLAQHRSRGWQLQLTAPMGRAVDEPDVLLQPYDLLQLFPLLVSVRDRAAKLGIQIWRGNNLGYFGPYEQLFMDWMPDRHGQGCGAGRTQIGIEANGTVKGCPSLTTRNWAGGNLRDAPMVAIWERAQALRYTRDRTVADLWGYCRECYYADVCRAGCTWLSDTLLGKPGNNPYCHHRALEFERRGERERIERVAEAPGEPFDYGLFRLVRESVDGKLLDTARVGTESHEVRVENE